MTWQFTLYDQFVKDPSAENLIKRMINDLNGLVPNANAVTAKWDIFEAWFYPSPGSATSPYPVGVLLYNDEDQDEVDEYTLEGVWKRKSWMFNTQDELKSKLTEVVDLLNGRAKEKVSPLEASYARFSMCYGYASSFQNRGQMTVFWQRAERPRAFDAESDGEP